MPINPEQFEPKIEKEPKIKEVETQKEYFEREPLTQKLYELMEKKIKINYVVSSKDLENFKELEGQEYKKTIETLEKRKKEIDEMFGTKEMYEKLPPEEIVKREELKKSEKYNETRDKLKTELFLIDMNLNSLELEKETGHKLFEKVKATKYISEKGVKEVPPKLKSGWMIIGFIPKESERGKELYLNQSEIIIVKELDEKTLSFGGVLVEDIDQWIKVEKKKKRKKEERISLENTENLIETAKNLEGKKKIVHNGTTYEIKKIIEEGTKGIVGLGADIIKGTAEFIKKTSELVIKETKKK